jgi:hypothetical protein
MWLMISLLYAWRFFINACPIVRNCISSHISLFYFTSVEIKKTFIIVISFRIENKMTIHVKTFSKDKSFLGLINNRVSMSAHKY